MTVKFDTETNQITITPKFGGGLVTGRFVGLSGSISPSPNPNAIPVTELGTPKASLDFNVNATLPKGSTIPGTKIPLPLAGSFKQELVSIDLNGNISGIKDPKVSFGLGTGGSLGLTGAVSTDIKIDATPAVEAAESGLKVVGDFFNAFGNLKPTRSCDIDADDCR